MGLSTRSAFMNPTVTTALEDRKKGTTPKASPHAAASLADRHARGHLRAASAEQHSNAWIAAHLLPSKASTGTAVPKLIHSTSTANDLWSWNDLTRAIDFPDQSHERSTGYTRVRRYVHHTHDTDSQRVVRSLAKPASKQSSQLTGIKYDNHAATRLCASLHTLKMYSTCSICMGSTCGVLLLNKLGLRLDVAVLFFVPLCEFAFV